LGKTHMNIRSKSDKNEAILTTKCIGWVPRVVLFRLKTSQNFRYATNNLQLNFGRGLLKVWKNFI
jgi:hypothetical protein